jgi:hypothetical protein
MTAPWLTVMDGPVAASAGVTAPAAVSGGECVEVADLPNGRAVRDSKHPQGPILVFTTNAWRAFVQGIEAGELRAGLQPR